MQMGTWKPDVIVGVARGGLIVAVTLAHQLKIRKVHSIGIARYVDQCAGDCRIYQMPDFDELPLSEKVLVVDDIADKGETLKQISRFLASYNVKYAALFRKEDCSFMPDFFIPLSKDIGWVVFPWEKQ
jgi:hypothetical protein